MTILVTGSTGFVGGALCKALCEQGHTVRAFHRASSDLTLLKGLDVEHVIGDLTQPETIRQAMQGVDTVFHAAAMLGSPKQSSRMYTVTVEGTESVLEAALEAGVNRLIHTSSVLAMGIPDRPSEQKHPDECLWMNENHTWNYRPDFHPYGYSKYLAELEVQKAVAAGLDVVIVNPTYIIGAGDIYRKTTSLVVQVKKSKVPLVPSGGINVVHIEDVVKGHLAAWKLGKTGQRYILGGENLTLMHLVHKIAAVVEGNAPNILFPGHLARRFASPISWLVNLWDLPLSTDLIRLAGYGFYYNTEKSRQVLNLDAPKTTEEAIRSAYDWFCEQGVL